MRSICYLARMTLQKMVSLSTLPLLSPFHSFPLSQISFEEFQGLLGGLEDLVKAQTGRYIADMTLRNVGQAGKIEAKGVNFLFHFFHFFYFYLYLECPFLNSLARETGRVVKDGSQFRFGYKFNALRKFNKFVLSFILFVSFISCFSSSLIYSTSFQ